MLGQDPNSSPRRTRIRPRLILQCNERKRAVGGRRLTCSSACLFSEQAAEPIWRTHRQPHEAPQNCAGWFGTATSYLPLRLDTYALISLI